MSYIVSSSRSIRAGQLLTPFNWLSRNSRTCEKSQWKKTAQVCTERCIKISASHFIPCLSEHCAKIFIRGSSIERGLKKQRDWGDGNKESKEGHKKLIQYVSSSFPFIFHWNVVTFYDSSAVAKSVLVVRSKDPSEAIQNYKPNPHRHFSVSMTTIPVI